MVRQHQIGFKSILVSLGSLMLDSLVDGAYPAIENRGHSWCARKAIVHLGTCPQRRPLRLRSGKPRSFLCPLGYTPAGTLTGCQREPHRNPIANLYP